MKSFAMAFLVWLIASAAIADEAAVRKYRDYTPQQLSRLPKEKLNAEVPMMYSMAAQTGLSVGSELLFAMQLNHLMYPGVRDYAAAVKAFQSDLGDKPTGELTVWQIHQLGQRAEMQKLARVGFPDQFSSYIGKESALVQGTVTIVDDKIAWPINHVRVSCRRSQHTCELDQLQLITPDENSWSPMYQVTQNITETYEIARWTRDSIESHPLGTSKDCRNTTLTFNFKTKEFYFITRNAGGDCKALGVELEKLAKPRIVQIVDGKKIIQSKFEEIGQAAFKVLSSEFRKSVDGLKAREKAR